MSLIGQGPVLVFAALAVAAAIIAAVAWLGQRKLIGLAALLCSILCSLTSALSEANTQVLMYPSWSSLAGADQAPHYSERRPASVHLPRHRSGHSDLAEYWLHGRSSGITNKIWVYLPADYDPHARSGRYPVIQVFAGFPGGPQTWLARLHLVHLLDAEIHARRMAPTVVVLANQVSSPDRDSECVDPSTGPRYDTFLTTDVVRDVRTRFRVQQGASGWGTIGYSTGGFCAVNLTYRHPDTYAAAASLSGYFSPFTDMATGDLYRGDKTLRHSNDVLWQLRHHPDRAPRIAIYAGASGTDRGSVRAVRDLVAAARAPLQVTPAVLPTGGHTFAVWQTLEAPALDWLSLQLASGR